jgi:hypothetical protein
MAHRRRLFETYGATLLEEMTHLSLLRHTTSTPLPPTLLGLRGHPLGLRIKAFPNHYEDHLHLETSSGRGIAPPLLFPPRLQVGLGMGTIVLSHGPERGIDRDRRLRRI